MSKAWFYLPLIKWFICIKIKRWISPLKHSVSLNYRLSTHVNDKLSYYYHLQIHNIKPSRAGLWFEVLSTNTEKWGTKLVWDWPFSNLPSSILIHLLLSGQPCKSLFHQRLQHWDMANQWADEAELLMLTKWNREGVPRWSTGSNLGQRPRRDNKMQTLAHIYVFNILCAFLWLFISSHPRVCEPCIFH